MLPKGAACTALLLLTLSLLATAQLNTGPSSSSRFYQLRRERPPGFEPNLQRRSFDAGAALRRGDFDPDVLNRFLEEYASKIKRTTERAPAYDGRDEDEAKDGEQGQRLEMMQPGDANGRNATGQEAFREDSTMLNDTIKRHKFYNANSNSEDRNTGWVTLDAIPWSKSKISKWQANPTTQGPWPDSKPWDKPSFNKPWNSDFPSRPASYESNKPWQNKKPHWSENSAAASNKPWYSQDRPRPGQQQQQQQHQQQQQQQQQPDRPSYPAIDKYEENPSQAQKWPPERPTWDRYSDSARPSSEIITDDGPPNFPSNTWDRPGQRPSYTHHTESYVSEPGGWYDRNDFPSQSSNKFNGRPSNNNDAGHYDRPNFSHYQYPPSNEHPLNHPTTGDGQWVLLSTNRGYSKSRQRSIKLEALVSANNNANHSKNQKQTSTLGSNGEEEEHVPAVTSKRQVRLTVLPSINGTNTTTSHGGLLEVERTFKTVDQSQKEYEMKKSSDSVKSTTNRAPPAVPIKNNVLAINRRPIRNTIGGSVGASNSAVLAAVGAGMLPATMAMMIPMMLGRRKRDLSYLRLPKEIFEREQARWRI